MSRAQAWCCLVAFSVAAAQAIWQAWGPPSQPRYFVESSAAYASPHPDEAVLYLRKTLFLAERPRHAWLQVIGSHRFQLYVNGELVTHKSRPGFAAADIVDVTRHMERGKNVIAVSAERTSLAGAMGVAIEGGYRLGAMEYELPTDDWRCSNHFERTGSAWFTAGFDDRRWHLSERKVATLRGEVDRPPGAARSWGFGRWIVPRAPEGAPVAVRGRFESPGQPRSAWVRVVTAAPYSMAINGVVIVQENTHLGLTGKVPALERVYDVTPATRAGPNSIALLLNAAPSCVPSVRIEGEVSAEDGQRRAFGSDSSWLTLTSARQSLAGSAFPGRAWERGAGWLGESDDGWQAARVIAGDAGVLPWTPVLAAGVVQLPLNEVFRRAGSAIALALTILIVARLISGVAGRILHARAVDSTSAAPLWLLPSVLLGAAYLSTYDPRFNFKWSEHRLLLICIFALVPLQWLWLWRTARQSVPSVKQRPGTGLAIKVGLAALVLVGGWPRVRMITAEPLNPDEVTVYRGAQGIWERGWPSYVVHPDMPVFELATSELMFYPVALAEKLTGDDRWAVRGPAMLWGILTILVMYWAGRAIFRSRSIALTAAAIYALSPVIIQMTGFGRYFAQLQFMTTVMVVCFWRALTYREGLDGPALWATAIAFVLTLLSWEGSALIALGMMAAALAVRWNRLSWLLLDRRVYAAMAVVAIIVALQSAHRDFQQASRLWYGTGATDIKITPMWRYPNFDLWYYVREASWNRDWLFPLAGLIGGTLLAIHSSFQRQARFLLLIFIPTAWLHVLILPVKAPRYSYHLTPLLILVSSAALVAGLRWLTGIVRPGAWTVDRRALSLNRGALKGPGRTLGLVIGVLAVALASGLTLQLEHMNWLHSDGYRLADYKFAHLERPCRYLYDRLRPGDVVLSTAPHVVEHHLQRWAEEDKSISSQRAGSRDFWSLDFWPESRLHLQAVLDDKRPVPLHRLLGVRMISSRQDLERLFSTHGRIWYIADPHFNRLLNEEPAIDFLREHMNVAYEDFSCLVLLAGERHRPAETRRSDRAEFARAPLADFLP
jgi:hypothetical protein